MRFHIICVGKVRRGPEFDLFKQYEGRVSGGLNVVEVEEKRPLSGLELKQREAELLNAKIPDGATVVALDERGKALASRAFADKLGTWRDDGARDLVFLIGGADGLDESLRQRADFLMAFGPQTWPHQMVRAMLAEQVYRAQSILAGHPYHRD